MLFASIKMTSVVGYTII